MVPAALESQSLCVLHFTLALEKDCADMRRETVLGRTIEEAISRAAPLEAKGYRVSYDMLGERAKTAKDAERYYERALSLPMFPALTGAQQDRVVGLLGSVLR